MAQADAARNGEAQKKSGLGTSIESNCITSFDTVIPSILVGEKTDTKGGVFECLKANQKNHSVWEPPGHDSGLKPRVVKGIKTVKKRVVAVCQAVGMTGEALALARPWQIGSPTFIESSVKIR